MHVVPDKDVIHKDANGSTNADRGRGVEMGKYATPTKQSKRTERVLARITSAGNFNRETKISGNGPVGGKFRRPHG